MKDRVKSIASPIGELFRSKTPWKLAKEEQNESPFFSLPLKICRIIYCYAFQPPNTKMTLLPEDGGPIVSIDVKVPEKDRSPEYWWGVYPMSRLLRINRQIHTEAKDVLYGSFFQFSFPNYIGPDLVRKFMNPWGENALAAIRRIEVSAILNMIGSYAGWWRRKTVGVRLKETFEILLDGLKGMKVVKLRVMFTGSFKTDYEAQDGMDMALELACIFVRVKQFNLELGRSGIGYDSVVDECRRRLAKERRRKRFWIPSQTRPSCVPMVDVLGLVKRMR